MKLPKLSLLNTTTCTSLRTMSTNDLKSIFSSAVAAVEPRKLIRETLQLHDGHLVVNGETHRLHKPCHLVGFGKAVYGMALEVEEILGSDLKEGVACVPKGMAERWGKAESRIRFTEGAENNLPDVNAMEGARAVKRVAEGVEENDLLLVLVSGGGSALLPLPLEGVTLDQKCEITQMLAKRGASITELNSVRKRLSQLKGGGLAEVSYPATVVALIISDVIGDPIDFIASGPTAVNLDSPQAAISIIGKYGLYGEIPDAVRNLLETDRRSEKSRAPIIEGKYVNVHNYIIGNNRIAAEAAVQKASSLGFQTVLLSTLVSGDVSELADVYAELAFNIACTSDEATFRRFSAEKFPITESAITSLLDLNFNSGKGICVVASGEPTVVVRGKGKGGRNQQLALAFSVALQKFQVDAEIAFLSCGTDGIDGPTDAAGAIGGSHVVDRSRREGLDPREFLNENDSYGFFCRYNDGENLVKVGHTGTNVMDVHILVMRK